MQETILSSGSIEQYLSSLFANGRSENTIRAYRADLREFLTWAGPIPDIQNFEAVAQQWLQDFRRTVAPKTTGRRLTTLRGYARWMGHEILKNYSAPTPPKSFPHPIPEGIEGLHRMAEAAKNPQQRALIGLCGFAGLRVAEALSICPDNIDIQDNIITVRGKGDKTRRVPMSSTCWMYLCEAYMDAPSKLPLITYQDRFARKVITSCAMRAGLRRRVSSHDLRATFATAAYDKTKDLRLVQELLGHSDPATTQVYTGVTLAQMRSAVQL